MTTCPECKRLQGNVGFARNDVGDLKTKLRRARDRDAPDFAARLKDALATLNKYEIERDAHEAVCETPLTPRRILDVRRPKPKPEPKHRQRTEIDREAMAAVLAEAPRRVAAGVGRNTLPATGYCHECDRQVSGERRFCGPCAANRQRSA